MFHKLKIDLIQPRRLPLPRNAYALEQRAGTGCSPKSINSIS